MCRKKKCKCHKKKKKSESRHPVAASANPTNPTNPFNPRRAVVEKPRRLKREPIDEVVYDPERQQKNPPRGFVDLILEPSDPLVRLKWKRRRR
jgi:hypothetical protein